MLQLLRFMTHAYWDERKAQKSISLLNKGIAALKADTKADNGRKQNPYSESPGERYGRKLGRIINQYNYHSVQNSYMDEYKRHAQNGIDAAIDFTFHALWMNTHTGSHSHSSLYYAEKISYALAEKLLDDLLTEYQDNPETAARLIAEKMVNAYDERKGPHNVNAAKAILAKCVWTHYDKIKDDALKRHGIECLKYWREGFLETIKGNGSTAEIRENIERLIDRTLNLLPYWGNPDEWNGIGGKWRKTSALMQITDMLEDCFREAYLGRDSLDLWQDIMKK